MVVILVSMHSNICGVHASLSSSERVAVVETLAAAGLFPSNAASHLPDSDPCDDFWDGVVCNSDHTAVMYVILRL